MKDTIYLIINKHGVDRMVKTAKSAQGLERGAYPFKLNINVPDDNFKQPYVEKDIVINRWDKGIDVEDVHFEQDYVTEEEAQMLRERRLEKMRDILEGQGYTVTRSEEESQ